MEIAEGKYYNWQRGLFLSSTDGCTLSDWEKSTSSAEFAYMPNGVLVFVPADQIDKLDGYQHGHFAMDVEPGSPLQKERLLCLLDLLPLALAGAGNDQRLLDVGCGTGELTSQVLQRFPSVELTGLDNAASALDKAAEKLQEAEFVLADCMEPPFAPNYFDAILCCNLLEHVESPTPLLSSIARVLKPGGRLILSTPSRYRFDSIARVVTGRSVTLMSPGHVTEYSVGQVLELLRFNGFTIDRVHGRSRLPKRWTSRNLISYSVLRPLLNLWKQASGSHHVLSSTAFFLARRTDESVNS